ncbi:MAG: chemotaxis protein CheW [bacterium]|nr:chemotaxis protein CheW [bacterium]
MQTDNTVLQQRFFLLPLHTREQGAEPVYCLFTQNQVVEVLGQRMVYPVPFSPDYVQGFIERDGGLVPVIDVDALCGGAGKKVGLQARQLLVMRTGQTDTANGEFLKLALACTSTVLTFKLAERDSIQAVAPEEAPAALASHSSVRGFFRLRGYLVALLDFDTVALGTYGVQDAADEKNIAFV